MIKNQLLLEVLGSDFIERTRSDARGRNAQLLGFGQNFFVLQAKLL